MGALLVYTFRSGLLLLAMYLVYKWMLAGENPHSYNRMLLLCMYAVSLVAFPLSEYAISAASTAPQATGFEIGVDLTFAMPGVFAESSVTAKVAQIILWIYVAGIAACSLGSILTAVRLSKIIRSGQKTVAGSYVLVLIDEKGIAPFSWYRYIVMSRADYAQAGEIIIAHEECHLAHRHWLDLLAAQVISTLLWYNPAAWLMREELKTVHEYQADESVLRSGIDARTYQRLLIKKAVGARFPSLANSLNHSKLKKRITMMYNQKTKKARRLRALALAPALAVGLYAVNIPVVASAINAVETAKMIPEQTSADKVTDNSSASQSPAAATDTPPEFPGGTDELYKFLAQNINYPEDAPLREEAKVLAIFTVKTDGSIDNIRIAGDDETFNNEAIRVIKSMPKWKPGTKAGKPTETNYGLPVRFKRPSTNIKVEGFVTKEKQDIIMLDETTVVHHDSQPTVYIDGLVVSSDIIKNLDPMRIESITIKKPNKDRGSIHITMKKDSIN